MAVQTKIQLRRDTAANWTSTNPVLADGEIGYDTTSDKIKIGNGTNTWSQLLYLSDASYLTGNASITTLTTSGNATIGGNLTVNGTTTYLNSSTVQVDDKNIELAYVPAFSSVTLTGEAGDTTVTTASTSGYEVGMSVTRTSGTLTLAGGTTIATIVNSTTLTLSQAPGGGSPGGTMVVDIGGTTDVMADGAGITVKGTTDKTWNWVDSTDSWTSNQSINLSNNQTTYKIAGTNVLTNTSVLGYTPNTANSASTIVIRDASGNFSTNIITATLYGTANLATNLVGGTANKGRIVYMSGVNTIANVDAGSTNNQVLAYNTSSNVPYWTTAPNIGTATGTSVNVTGQLISTQTTGTAPLSVASTTVVTNLNADLLDGYNTATAATANTVAVRDANASITANVFIGSSANVTGQLISTVVTGTAPFSVASTTKVANLNADTLDGYDTATAATANTVAVRDANASITANVFIGSSANVTGQLISTVTTGTAPLSVASTTRVTNLNAATAGVADSATIAGQANNITATANNIVYVGATANILSTLAYSASNNGQVLTISGGQPTFATPAAQGVTSITAGAGLTGGTITSTGTVALNLAYGSIWTTTQQVNVSSDVVAFAVKGASSGTANLIEARNNGGTMMMSLSNTGTLFAVTIDGGSA